MWWIAAAAAQQITMGVDRVALLDPGFQPTAVDIGDRRVVEVAPSAPVLLIYGLRPGTTTVGVERADGSSAQWKVEVQADDSAPTGGPGLVERREVLTLTPGGGAVCAIAAEAASKRVADERVAVQPFGSGRWIVWAGPDGHGDLVFEDEAKGPRVLAVGAGNPAAGASCQLPTGEVRVAVGATLDVDVGRKPATVWVVDPGVAHAAAGEGNAVRLTAVRPGTTVLAVRSGDRDAPFLRTVVVTRP
ncbi:MAG: pilus assembly protein N-terminal domain-containing protein [Myxococcales bacterium]|nr:pilus assembly protein N-terminal domain-containing protein [Myxococcales bacterium]